VPFGIFQLTYQLLMTGFSARAYGIERTGSQKIPVPILEGIITKAQIASGADHLVIGLSSNG